jgi:hypothetical protein
MIKLHPYRFFLTSGGLMSYGIDYATRFEAGRNTLTAFSAARSLPICRAVTDQI